MTGTPDLLPRCRGYRNRESWLAARGLLLGASEAAALLGLSPYGGPWDVYRAKRDGRRLSLSEVTEGGGVDISDPLIRGQVMEPMVGAAYGVTTGRRVQQLLDVAPVPDSTIATVHHPHYRWLAATLDAVVTDADMGMGAGEWKTSRSTWAWGPSGATVDGSWDAIIAVMPEHIAVQVIVQLAVTGLGWAAVCVLTGGLTIRHYTVMRHEPTIAAMVSQLAERWRRHVTDGTAPDLDGSEACVRACRANLRANRGRRRVATAREAELIAVVAARAVAAAAASVAVAELLTVMGDCQALTLPPGPRGEPHGVRVSSSGSVTVY